MRLDQHASLLARYTGDDYLRPRLSPLEDQARVIAYDVFEAGAPSIVRTASLSTTSEMSTPLQTRYPCSNPLP
jgi:hypothetical protein